MGTLSPRRRESSGILGTSDVVCESWYDQSRRAGPAKSNVLTLGATTEPFAGRPSRPLGIPGTYAIFAPSRASPDRKRSSHGQPDQFPLLEPALMQIWDDWEERGNTEEPLDLDHYEASELEDLL